MLIKMYWWDCFTLIACQFSLMPVELKTTLLEKCRIVIWLWTMQWEKLVDFTIGGAYAKLENSMAFSPCMWYLKRPKIFLNENACLIQTLLCLVSLVLINLTFDFDLLTSLMLLCMYLSSWRNKEPYNHQMYLFTINLPLDLYLI